MPPDPAESELVARAVTGDEHALERLLLQHYDRLATDVERRLPRTLRGVIAAEDVLQEAFIVAFRDIRGFTPRGPDSFYAWLATLTRHRLLDLVKAHRSAKRGGGRPAVETMPRAPDDSLASLLDVLCVSDRTPSRSAAGREALYAVQIGLAGLKSDYREALRLRYLVNLPVAEIAARLNRTERAVHMLCHRGLEQLRAVLGRSSQYLSRKQ